MTRRPTFAGTAAAFAIVELFARPSNADTEVALGQTIADPNGRWNLVARRLPAGAYFITARVTPPAGYPSEMMSLTQNGGTFFIALSPGRKRHPNPAARAALHFGRSTTRPIAALRTLGRPFKRVFE